jgi:hypothetical protein
VSIRSRSILSVRSTVPPDSAAASE